MSSRPTPRLDQRLPDPVLAPAGQLPLVRGEAPRRSGRRRGCRSRSGARSPPSPRSPRRRRARSQVPSSATLRSFWRARPAPAPAAAAAGADSARLSGRRSGGLLRRRLVRSGLRLGRRPRRRAPPHRRQARPAPRGACRSQLLEDLRLDLGRDLGVLGEELFGVVAALAEPRLAVGEERARFLDQVVLDAEVEQAALREMPTPYSMSNSAWRNGEATLFLTTLTRTRLPTASVPP